ncbi:hypothetical protein DEM26_15110 [Thioclava sp. NG1]|nr:hypothetical protein DEM26_15110 [Thioclava sp. NG1]
MRDGILLREKTFERPESALGSPYFRGWNILKASMHCHYKDILSRIATPPDWFDENAVPRWGRFLPFSVANFYAKETALAEIRCQACQRIFQVAFSELNMQPPRLKKELGEEHARLAEVIEAKLLHYGDPPNIDCCSSGPTMNSVPLRVLEYWHRPSTPYHLPREQFSRHQANTLETKGWVRDPRYEVALRG